MFRSYRDLRQAMTPLGGCDPLVRGCTLAPKNCPYFSVEL